MSGETNLDVLLKEMTPTLADGEFVFISLAEGRYGDAGELRPIAMMMEDEGMTLVIPKSLADERGYRYDSVFRSITLAVHSSLDAVGFTAAFSAKLAEENISANVISGLYHDHIFVPAERSADAMRALNGL